MLPLKIIILLACGPIAYLLSQAFLPRFFASLTQSAAPDPVSTQSVSVIIGIVAFIGVAAELKPGRRSTKAFRTGAEGEVLVGRILDRLSRHDYVTIHDIPFGRGNIDHVTIGPGGIFTVETKNTAGPVRIRGRRVSQQGRNREEHVAQAYRQACHIRARLSGNPQIADLPVYPLLVYPRAEIQRGFLSSNVVEGVRIVGRHGLRRTLKSARRRLNSGQIAEASRHLSE